MQMDAPTVLVVDDDLGIRESLAEALAGEGYFVRTARDGLEALLVIRELNEMPCIVLLDMMMPVMGGADVMRVLREEGRLESVSVVVISATKPSFDASAGARLCLHKPIALEVLLTVLERLSPASPLASCSRVRGEANRERQRKV